MSMTKMTYLQTNFLVLSAICLTIVISASIPESSTPLPPSNPTTESSICHNRTPCRWVVYTPFTRKIDYIMNNTCVCRKGTVCVKTEDDLSVSAYIWRCRDEKENKGDLDIIDPSIPSS